MSGNEFDSELEQAMMDSMPSEPERATDIPAWKAKLAALKAGPPPIAGNGSATIPTAHLIMKGDPSAPQNQLEADIEADRQLGRKAIDEGLEKDTHQILNAEALYIETIANESHDKERFHRIFIDVIQQKFLGKTLDETEHIIRDMHETLFDVRTGIQAGMVFRNQLLKDVDAEARADRLKKDWLFKPATKVRSDKEKKASSPKAPKKSMFETMRDSMMAVKGISKEEAENRLKAKGFQP